MRRLDIAFDGSTLPGTVIVNGTRMSFETDDEAKLMADLLRQVNYAWYIVENDHRDLKAKLAALVKEF